MVIIMTISIIGQAQSKKRNPNKGQYIQLGFQVDILCMVKYLKILPMILRG